MFELGFTVCLGRYFTQSVKKRVTERSNIVYCRDKGEDRLVDFASAAGEKYGQGSLLFCDSNGEACLLYTSGSLKGHTEKLGAFSTRNLTDYYTKAGKNKFSLSDTVINGSESGETCKNMSEFMSLKVLKGKLNTSDFGSFCDFYKRTSTGDKQPV